MALLSYLKGVWTALLPAATRVKMENIEDGIKAASDILDLETDAGRAITQAADAAAQRSALGLGDSATKNVGTGAGDVAAGASPAAAQAAAEATAAGALAGHVAAADPHTQYAKEADLGDSATLDVGTGAGDVAAGNAPAGAVTAHESTYAHANLPTADEKTRLGDIQAASGATTQAKLQAVIADASTTNKGVALLAADGGTTAGTVVQANDSRITTAPIAWTPIPKFGGVADDGTYAILENRLIKIGKKYLYEARLLWSAKGTKTGEFTIGGIVAPASAASMPCGWIAADAGMASLVAGSSIMLMVGAVNMTFRTHVVNGLNVALTDANFTNTSDVRIHLEYIAA